MTASDAYMRGWDDGLHNRRLNAPATEPARSEYRQGYVDGQRVRRLERKAG